MNKKQIIALFSEYLDECGLTHSFESFLCSKGLTIEYLFKDIKYKSYDTRNSHQTNKRP